MKWVKVSSDIRYREHESRRYGNHPDRYYSIYYRVDGKLCSESLGWESKNRIPGMSMLQRAEALLAQIRQNRRTGEGPVTKKERREEADFKKAETARQRKQAELTNMPLNEFFEAYFKPFVERKLKPTPLRTELGNYRNWIKDIFGAMPLNEINLMSWDKLLAKFNESKVSPRTKEYICGTLCRILKFAADRGYETYVPTMKKLGIIKAENRRL